jgi:ATP-dependent exoDNAse (exonuclease V) alpha subunit
MHCGDDMASLINAMYSDLLTLQPHQHLPDGYFLDHTILTPRNVQVHEINTSILEAIQPQEKITYISADSITDREYDYIQPEVLHSLNPARFPLHKLELKNGAPLMLLRNLDPIHGLYNGTRLRLIRSTPRILECRVLKEGGNGEVVLIPRIALDSGLEDSPVPFRRLQFPVHLAYAMTINKSQGQSVRNVGIDLRTSVFSHGQLYVALSRCTHPRRIKVLFKNEQEDTKTTNVVWPEVFVNLNI